MNWVKYWPHKSKIFGNGMWAWAKKALHRQSTSNHIWRCNASITWAYFTMSIMKSTNELFVFHKITFLELWWESCFEKLSQPRSCFCAEAIFQDQLLKVPRAIYLLVVLIVNPPASLILSKVSWNSLVGILSTSTTCWQLKCYFGAAPKMNQK